MASVCVQRTPVETLGVFGSHLHLPLLSQLDRVLDKQSFGQQSVVTGFRMQLDNGAFGSATTTILPKANQAQFIDRRPVSHKKRPVPADPLPKSRDKKDALLRDEDVEYSVPFSPQLDKEVATLIERINEKVVIKDLAVKSPIWIEVPKGYMVESDVRPSAFYRIRTEVRKYATKRKREIGFLPVQDWRHERHGYQAQELNTNGAVSLHGCRPPNLTNAIHPLFQRSCFDDTPDTVYNQLIPGLQLATMFLTQPICMQFWITLAMGDRRDDNEMSTSDGKLSQRIDRHVELTEKRAKNVIEHIRSLGHAKLIHFRFKNKLRTVQDDGGAWGSAAPICDYQGVDSETHRTKGSLVRSIIKLHADYYITAKKFSQLKYPEISQKLRFSFCFAVLICHEVAHSVEGIHMRDRGNQWLDWHTSRYYREPYWLDWQEAECGRAWEETMFGGEISPINDRVDGAHGVAISDWPVHGSSTDPFRRIWRTISTAYIENLFQMSTWQRNFDLRDWRYFNIPHDGAVSLYINSFTTMSVSEEQRVADEEMAELVALSNEQPANKKRITRTGKTEEHRPKADEVIEQVTIERDEQIKKQGDEPKRHVPVFSNIRRLSSVMSGPLPDIKNRVILEPRLRKSLRTKPASSQASQTKVQGRKTDSLSQELKLPTLVHDGNHRQVAQESNSTVSMQSVEAKSARNISIPRNPAAKRTASALIRSHRPKPKGLLDKYRRRKKASITKRVVNRKLRIGMTKRAASKVMESLTQDAGAEEKEDTELDEVDLHVAVEEDTNLSDADQE